MPWSERASDISIRFRGPREVQSEVSAQALKKMVYERLVKRRQHASAIGLEALGRFGICDLVDIGAIDVFAQRRFIAEGGSEIRCFPRVDGGIIGARLGGLAASLFREAYRRSIGSGREHHDPVNWQACS